MPRHFLLVLISVFCCSKLTAQDSTLVVTDTLQPSRWQMLQYDGGSILRGVIHAYAAPAHWKKDNWLTFGGAAAATGIMWATDQQTSEYFTDQAHDIPEWTQEAGFRFGKPLLNYGLTGGIYTIGILTKNEKIRQTGVLLISSATAAGVLQTILKSAVGRARPTAGVGTASFKPFSGNEKFHSFPSGHAILSFTTAYAISKQFESPWVKGGIWAVGMVTPVSRLWAGAHWLSDVSVGVLLSVATVESIDRYLKANRHADDGLRSKKKISWNLQCTSKTIGIVGVF